MLRKKKKETIWVKSLVLHVVASGNPALQGLFALSVSANS